MQMYKKRNIYNFKFIHNYPYFCPEFKNMQGLVIKSTGYNYHVLTENNICFTCCLRGNFRIRKIKTTNPIVVGDFVIFEETDTNFGVITEILPRKNYIIRKSVNLSKVTHIIAANIDMAFLVVTLKEPRTSLGFIDRFLIAAEAYRIPVCLVFNKMDIYNNEELDTVENWINIYQNIGYRCLKISALKLENLESLKSEMKHKTALFSGHSGVGKSAIINAIEPALHLKIGSISDYHQKGQHTTTFAEMYPLGFGGFIIDSPGIKEFGLLEYDKEEISHYFLEMRALMSECKFNNCTHTHEPGCAVKKALQEGKIAQSRYDNYQAIIHNDDMNIEHWQLR